MNGYNFTERVRRVIRVGREEAERLGHEHVAPEHLLLGLLIEQDGLAWAVLESSHVDVALLRQTLDETVKKRLGGQSGPDVPYTAQTKHVLQLAMTEAGELSHGYVGTEHLLLGILREGKNSGAQILAGLGLTLEVARAETLKILGVESDASSASHERRKGVRTVGVILEYADGQVVRRDFSDRIAAMEYLRRS